MTHKYVVSRQFMQLVHVGIMSRQGLKSALESVERQRQTRYLLLRSLFGERVRQQSDQNPLYIAPMPPTLEQIAARHRVSDQDTLTRLWFTWSDLYSAVSEMVMNAAEVKKVVRIDHSRKFTRLLKQCGDVFDSDDVQAGGSKKKKKDAANFQLLLLAQNECGQIVGRVLTASENHAETEALQRERIKPRIEKSGGKHVLVCDNANAVRGLASAVFGDRVETKQDPFRVIQRFTDKVRPGNERKRVAREISASLYDASRQLRVASEMRSRLQVTVDSVAEKDLSCSREEWERTVASNLKHIERGDLSIDDNFYRKNGKSSKVISTSQLEGIHSQLKRTLSNPVSIGVGMRVMDIFILEHNLKVGATWGRNPNLGQVDFLQLCRSALMCRGAVPESRAFEFALGVISKPIEQPRNRLTAAYDFPFRRWIGIFHAAQPSVEALQLQAHTRPKYPIAELMSRTATRVTVSAVSRTKLLESLNIAGGDIEASGSLSPHEMQLMIQIRREMAAFKACTSFIMGDELDWTSCPIACTILYNLAVSVNTNPSLALSRRRFLVVQKSIPVVDELVASTSQKFGKLKQQMPLFVFRSPRQNDDENTAHERAIQADLYNVLKSTRDVVHRKRVFVRLYTLAACMLERVNAKSFKVLFTRWETLLKAHGRQHEKEIAQSHQSLGSVPNAHCAAQQLPLSRDPSCLIDAEPAPASCEAAASARAACSAAQTSQSVSETDEQTVSGRVEAVSEPVEAAAAECLPTRGPNEALTVSQLPLFVTPQIVQEDKEELLRESEMLMGHKGKWKHLYSKYQQMYPTSRIGQNAFRCRVVKAERKRKTGGSVRDKAPVIKWVLKIHVCSTLLQKNRL